MKTPILKVEDLYYAYGSGETVLDGVSVDIHEGQRIAVVGSNGSGKSTFFLNLNGVLTPDKGRVIYRDMVMDKKNLKKFREKVGIVFQDADNQIIASTVRAEVGFGPMNLKLPKQEVQERVEEALAYMNISGFMERAPHYLSGGEKKRVSIADILAMKPEIIVFDEPMAALDPLNAKMLEEVLHRLSQEGKTMLVSVHDVDFAYRWAERVLVFCRGKIIADGTPLEIFQNKKILEEANLKQPTLLELYEAMVEGQRLENNAAYPKSVEEFRRILAPQ